MTKKHFIRIAAILKNVRANAQHSVFLQDKQTTNLVVDNIRKELIKMFIEENPNFDLNKFIKASNLTEEEKRLAI